MTEPTEACHDGGMHVFLDDGGETPGGISCALCDQDYAAWCVKFKPAPPQPPTQETTPC